ncbi:DUF2267 domain-containing protein [Mesorhizobium salmacidum]|uniref:DUF2267 domain-containing protein n=1 Tax=Mesorhizobium salmacidum TaxID=3015171 RepID=A0ABU8L4S6_9HYPH
MPEKVTSDHLRSSGLLLQIDPTQCANIVEGRKLAEASKEQSHEPHRVPHLFATFNHAAQQAQQWVNELAKDLGWSEPSAYRLMRSVLRTLRDWLSPAETADLSAQLPVLVRGVYFDGWKPSPEPACERKKRDFITSVRASFGYDDEIDFDIAINAVFTLLERHISHREIVQIRSSMKKSLRELWPAD